MKVQELIQKSQMVIDSTGKTKAVQIDYSLWEELLELLEDMEGAAKTDAAYSHGGSCGSGELHRPFGLCAGEFTTPDNFDDPLPNSVIAEFEGRIQ